MAFSRWLLALTSDALAELERLTLISTASDVFLAGYGAEIEEPHHDYAVFQERIEKMPPGQVAFPNAKVL